MPTLKELSAQFVGCKGSAINGDEMTVVASIADAAGVSFLCPKCLVSPPAGGGIHAIVCWSSERGAPIDAKPGPARWSMRGSTLDDLSLDGENGRSRTVYLDDPGCGWDCDWTGTVTNGWVENNP